MQHAVRPWSSDQLSTLTRSINDSDLYSSRLIDLGNCFAGGPARPMSNQRVASAFAPVRLLGERSGMITILSMIYVVQAPLGAGRSPAHGPACLRSHRPGG